MVRSREEEAMPEADWAAAAAAAAAASLAFTERLMAECGTKAPEFVGRGFSLRKSVSTLMIFFFTGFTSVLDDTSA